MTEGSISPLLSFMRALTPQQKKDFIAACETTYVYMHQLATQPRPNPALRLAKSIVEESKKLSRKVMHAPLTYDDLLFETIQADEIEKELRKPRKP